MCHSHQSKNNMDNFNVKWYHYSVVSFNRKRNYSYTCIHSWLNSQMNRTINSIPDYFHKQCTFMFSVYLKLQTIYIHVHTLNCFISCDLIYYTLHCLCIWVYIHIYGYNNKERIQWTVTKIYETHLRLKKIIYEYKQSQLYISFQRKLCTYLL